MSKVRVNWGAASHDSSVRLYEVYNTAHHSLLVLAPDKDTAIKIAHTANHIHGIWDRKDKSYPHLAEVRDPFSPGQSAESLESIKTAIAQRLQGTVHFDDGQVLVGDKVISA